MVDGTSQDLLMRSDINPKLRRTFFTEDMSFRFGAIFFCEEQFAIPSKAQNLCFAIQNFCSSKVLQFITFATQNFCNPKLLQLKTFAAQNFCNSKPLQLEMFATQTNSIHMGRDIDRHLLQSSEPCLGKSGSCNLSGGRFGAS